MKPGSKIQAPALAALLALPLLAAACGRERPAPPPPTSAEPVVETLRKLHVLDAEGKVVVTFRWDEDEVQLFFNEDGKRRYLRSRLGKGRQRRWNERGVGPVALVRTNPKATAFTLRSVDGSELLWRIKYGERVALFRDHAEKSGFDIRQRRDKGYNVTTEEGSELGGVKVVAKSKRVQITDPEGELVYKAVKNTPVSKIYGVLLAPDLDPMVRYILMAEMLVR